MPCVPLFIKSFFILDTYESETQHAENPSQIIFQRHSTRSLVHTQTDTHRKKKLWLEKQNNTLSELIISIRSQRAAQQRQISWLSSCEHYIPGFLFSLPLSSRFLASRPFVIFLPQRLSNWICLIKHSSNCHVRSESLYDQQRRKHRYLLWITLFRPIWPHIIQFSVQITSKLNPFSAVFLQTLEDGW